MSEFKVGDRVIAVKSHPEPDLVGRVVGAWGSGGPDHMHQGPYPRVRFGGVPTGPYRAHREGWLMMPDEVAPAPSRMASAE